MPEFTHIRVDGAPHMVDISGKPPTVRTAWARAEMRLGPEIVAAFDGKDLVTPKGSVTQTAVVAGIQAAKKTSELLPLCHILPLDQCEITVTPDFPGHKLLLDCRVRATWKTGVEMEALTGASVAALTVYDLCKSISHDMEILSVRLMEKTGGKTGIQPPPSP
ncbi:MAG: cyclic pyranopterin monophosphate synthase MoaC [Verrucomicrobia bacterium]|nr:cyclic pyranopterin monophosphate synthase MoaC [Kiritimatiellia bacterium]MCP5488412.1 cyclic pyranopterin monophosphate synthase MoaC [Verrucomicrobiota bacterium]